MTGTGEMIERVARAICQADEQNGGPSWEYVRSLGERGVSGYFDRARAAIEAMREPTEAMALAGIEADMESGFGATMAWQAMINKALE